MKPLAAYAAFLSLFSLSSAAAGSSSASLPSTFKPPQVFKNVNLVHIISLEKNYVKESINVLIENTASTPQDEYFLPFSTEQMSRVGSVEVKDRKEADIGPFVVDAVEYDPKR